MFCLEKSGIVRFLGIDNLFDYNLGEQMHLVSRLLFKFSIVTLIIMSPQLVAAQETRRVHLQARLVEKGPVLKDGVEWRVFSKKNSATNSEFDELAFSKNGVQIFNLQPGEYYVHASFDHTAAIKKILVSNKSIVEEFILHAGGLKLSATATGDVPIPSRLLRFDVYEKKIGENGTRKQLAQNIKPGEILAFPVGTYHVVSHFGDLNATVRADIRIQLGKMTEASLQHRASIMTFRLVRQAGGDGVADTAWSILAENGEVIRESTSTFPSMVLAEGNYTAIAKHNDNVYSQDIKVVSGFNSDIEVIVPN